MKKLAAAVLILICLTMGTLVSAGAVSLNVDGAPVTMNSFIRSGTTYVPIRAMSNQLYPDTEVSWENGRAVVRKSGLIITARPGDFYIEANGRVLYASGGVVNENGSVMIPVRALIKAFGGTVDWDGANCAVLITSVTGTIEAGDTYYDGDSVTWLSRIIEAESSGEPLLGKVAVGNVILNRVQTPDFPNSIYGVIFDARWGGQFEPAKNGTINNTPSAESILAAKLCLDGASVVDGSLFFLNPALSSNFWTMENCDFVATIGSHQFYA